MLLRVLGRNDGARYAESCSAAISRVAVCSERRGQLFCDPLSKSFRVDSREAITNTAHIDMATERGDRG